MKKGLFPRLRQKPILLDRFDCEGIASLAANGFTLGECLEILEDENNEKCFRLIREHLEKGEEAGGVFSTYCPKRLSPYVSGFMRTLPFSEALPLAVMMSEAGRKSAGQYFSKTAYPAFLFLMMLVGSLCFTEICFPALTGMLEGFRTDISVFSAAAGIIRTASIITLTALLFLTGFILYCLQEEKQAAVYQRFAGRRWFRVVVEYASSQFIVFYTQCLKMNLHTRDCVAVIRTMKHHPVISWMAQVLDEALLQGERFDRAMHQKAFDPVLYRFLKIASQSDDASVMMDSYLQMANQRMLKKCRRFSALIQMCAYTGCGILLIIVYQILMLPLSVLSGI